MRTQEEILQEMSDEAVVFTDPELEQLEDNDSRVSFWQYCKKVVAFAIFTLEKMFEQHKTDVNEMIDKTEFGSINWWREIVLNYQDGDSLQLHNNRVVYSEINEENRIIKRASIKERKEGGLQIKVAKADGINLVPLDNNELVSFSSYLEKVKFVGIPLDIISLPADPLTLNMTIELESYLYNVDGTKKDGTTPVSEAITNFLQNFGFDDTFYISKLIDAIQKVEGVKDVFVTSSAINGKAFTRYIETKSGHLKLDNENSKIEYVLT